MPRSAVSAGALLALAIPILVLLFWLHAAPVDRTTKVLAVVCIVLVSAVVLVGLGVLR